MRCFRRGLLAAVCLGFVGCLSPTLPLPPPSEPTVEQVGEHQYRLSGRAPGSSWVVALNLRTEQLSGDLSQDDGSYSFVVTADPSDTMNLWYSVTGELSSPRTFEIQELAAPASDGGSLGGDSGSNPPDSAGP